MSNSTQVPLLMLSPRVRTWIAVVAGMTVAWLGATAWMRADERETQRQMLDVRAALEHDGFTGISVKRAVVVVPERSFQVSMRGNVEKLSTESAATLSACDRLAGFIVQDEVRAFPNINTPKGFVGWSGSGAYMFQRSRK